MKQLSFSADGMAHRPWSVPASPWVMGMQWHNLAFLHWPVAAEQLRPFVPRGLTVDTFDGTAWLGVVPFLMRKVRVRGMPPLPGTGAFSELNLRTYVSTEGRPGVWFFSLDAASRLAVRVARRTFHVPYFDARMHVQADDDGCGHVYRSRRTEGPPGEFEGRYRSTGKASHAAPGTLEHWLTERYCLYSADRRGRIYRGEVHHPPWPLEHAECEIESNTLANQLKIDLPLRPALVHFARRLDVVAWCVRRIC